jgi:hypothetical protein
MIVDLCKTNIKRRQYAGVQIGLCLTALIALPVSASAAGAISQGFQTTSSAIMPGTILSFGPAQGQVQPATSNNVLDLVGIASPESLVELSSGSKNIQVVVSGLTDALVSNVNGSIKAGDKVTASPFSGVGMKATGPTEIVGVAQASLSSEKVVQQSVTAKNGKMQTITVGSVPLQVNVAYYSTSQGGSSSIYVPPVLQSIANAITGEQVSPLRVLASALTLVLGFGTVGIILYTSIKSSITAIGRNPLANLAVRKGLVDVLIMATGILAVTIVTIYIIVGK